MPRVLIISSYVAHGTVGISATAPPLRHAGIEVMAVPTTVLSNHPGHAHVAGAAITPETLLRMIDALAGNGWLNGLDALISGYLPSPAHVAAISAARERVIAASAACLYVCDPVLGDDPHGLYVPKEVARAVRDDLVPRAHVITPNRFELAYLTNSEIGSVGDAVAAARRLGAKLTAATSIPAANDAPDGTLVNVLVSDNQIATASVEGRTNVAHGTGDVFTGLLSAHLIAKSPLDLALTTATLVLDRVIEASGTSDTLDLGEFFGRPSA